MRGRYKKRIEIEGRGKREGRRGRYCKEVMWFPKKMASVPGLVPCLLRVRLCVVLLKREVRGRIGTAVANGALVFVQPEIAAVLNCWNQCLINEQ